MSLLIDDLKEEREEVLVEIDTREQAIKDLQEELPEWYRALADFDRAIAALEPAPDFSAEQETAREQLEREPEIEPVPSDEVDTALETPRTWREYERSLLSSDDDTPSEHISILTGDPAIEPESGLHGEAIVARQSYMDGDQLIVHEITASEFMAPPLVNVTPEAPALDASMHDEREQPVQTEPDGYAPVTRATDPDADFWARGVAPAEPEKKHRFSIFGHKRETEEVS